MEIWKTRLIKHVHFLSIDGDAEMWYLIVGHVTVRYLTIKNMHLQNTMHTHLEEKRWILVTGVSRDE